MGDNINNHQKPPHAIIVSWPLQGHINPSVNLAIKLASSGFSITFLNTQSIHHRLCNSCDNDDGQNDIFAPARRLGLDIRYETVGDGFPVEFDRHHNLDQFFKGFWANFEANVDDLVGRKVQSPEESPPVNILIADTFYWWTSRIAEKYGIVSVSLWTEPALAFTLYYHSDLLTINGHINASKDNRNDTINYIPGVPAIQPTDLMSHIRDSDTSTTFHQMIFEAFKDVKKVDYILCNTIQELENDTISSLQQKQPIFAIGPIFPSEFNNQVVSASLLPESDCIEWLNTKPHGSVLYVSFGSLVNVNQTDILEIAHGLVLSGVNFVWVLRSNIISSVETYSLPQGFEDDINDKGLIVPWCNQIDVISHPSVRGFLTHCGWNSVLESVWCAVTMLCFPLKSDQFTNRKLVVDDWRVGINLCEGKSVTREEVAKNVNRLMIGKSTEEMRNEIKKLKRTLEVALDIGGSSEKNFTDFVKELKTKIV